MKKIIAMLLVAVMALGMVACSTAGDEGTTNAPTTTAPADTTPDDTTPDDTTPDDTTPDGTTVAGNEASAVLSAAWDLYDQEQKFFAMGGDYNAPVDGAPGVVDMTSTDYILYSLLVPEAELANITEAASLMHAMNANTFTCGAYKLAEGADPAAFATAMQTAIQSNQWMCGFPENLLIANVEGIMVVAYGHGEVMANFQTSLTAAYADAEIVVNEAITG